MVVVNNIMFVSAATGVRTIDDAKKKPLAIGATGASSPSVLYPQVSNNLFGTKFKIVSGYPGGGDINLAVERGEVDGRGSNSWASMKANNPDWLRDHKVNILFQVGPHARSRPARRAAVERARAERRAAPDPRGALRRRRGRPADPDRAGRAGRSGKGAARRRSTTRCKDPKFIAAAKQANMYLNPMGGEELQQIVSRIVSPSPR